jgi:prepilin signal peptidase PulO-like enzyme (type II secretory pathway)
VVDLSLAGVDSGWTALAMAVTFVGLGLGAYWDWRSREVSDALWVGMAVLGAIIGGAVLAGSHAAPIALASWGAVVALAFVQLLPWDAAAERIHGRLPEYLEIAAFVVASAFLVLVGFYDGVGSQGLPIASIAAFASILLGRGLFEVRLLYGGADAKALIATGLVIPILATPILVLPEAATQILSIYPFSLTLLMNAALVAIAIPLWLGLENLRAGEFRFPQAFTGRTIPVRELPDRFVWLKDPTFAPEEEDDTTEDDVALRRRQRSELEARGVARVWVTPQLPFVTLMFLGAVLAILFGNLLFDLLSIL